MKITKGKLTKLSACGSARTFFSENKGWYGLELIPFLKKLMSKEGQVKINNVCNADSVSWGNWLIVRCMTYKQYVSYAIYAAKQGLDIFEKKYPKDKRPRQAIDAALKCLKNPTDENKAYAATAATAAYDDYAATAAAAVAAAYASAYAAYDAYAAAYDAAYDDYDDVRLKMKIKILRHGIKLLKNQPHETTKEIKAINKIYGGGE